MTTQNIFKLSLSDRSLAGRGFTELTQHKSLQTAILLLHYTMSDFQETYFVCLGFSDLITVWGYF